MAAGAMGVPGYGMNMMRPSRPTTAGMPYYDPYAAQYDPMTGQMYYDPSSYPQAMDPYAAYAPQGKLYYPCNHDSIHLLILLHVMQWI